jgi:hypothetical protein
LFSVFEAQRELCKQPGTKGMIGAGCRSGMHPLRLAMCALILTAGCAALAAPPAAALEWCQTDMNGDLHCGFVPVQCYEASDLIPFVTIECEDIFGVLK